MYRIALIAKYFGNENSFLPFWFFSVSKNPTIDFIFLTDTDYYQNKYSHITNVRFFIIQKNDFAERVKLACGVNYVDLDKFGYHCNQFRPMFGEMFSDLLINYDYWGYVDTDVVFGDIRSFFPDDLLNSYDKFLERGHFTIFKNDKAINKRYLLTKKWCKIDYEKICKTSLNFGFDEMHGINVVYEKEGFSYYKNFRILLDCDICTHELTPCQKDNPFFKKPAYLIYGQGRLTCFNSLTGENKDILYAHFQKRKMVINSDYCPDSTFYIYPNCIISLDLIGEEQVVKISRKKTKIITIFKRLKYKIKNIPRYFGLFLLAMKKRG